MDKFQEDLDKLMAKLILDCDADELRRMEFLEHRLIDLREKNLLKINHSVLELIVAKYLVKDGYDVDLEHTIDAGLNCDVYGRKGDGTVIIEVETGYVPPAHALDPLDYIKARIASKIARYSNHCNKFLLAAPPHYIMPIPRFFTLPPRDREQSDLNLIKRYCDMYYTSPPVSQEEIINSRIHGVEVVDVETASLREMEPSQYIDMAQVWYI
ncbi:MAG: hypothetical protein A4E32_00135 [Methanomassiliicoccales archaeon PtaU1.Bin124]|nr:MAG: hypothetical protein A4E32_00135 [Methanomassiliicoccales archaeon PtaU1.Bin124]